MYDSPKSKPTAKRPVTYDEDVVLKLLERLVEGESLSSICRDESMPSRNSVMRWRRDKPEFAQQYVIALMDRADVQCEEILEIADDGKHDYVDVDGRRVVDFDHIARSRLRVDTRKWVAARMHPKKYGDMLRQEITGADGTALVPPSIAITFPDGGPGRGGTTDSDEGESIPVGDGAAEPEAP